MKELKIKKIETTGVKAIYIPLLFAVSGVKYNEVEQVNWAEYPYLPEVEFAIGHNGDQILIHYRVTEQSVRAEYDTDNGDVWKDSCVEFFVQFDGDPLYYNIECNCVGTLLMGMGEKREGRTRADSSVTSTIDRWASLGSEAFGLRDTPTVWEVALAIPCEVFSQTAIQSLDGAKMRANFYKCGDGLPVPHFVSWNAIAVEHPDFHRPDFFGSLVCEDNS